RPAAQAPAPKARSLRPAPVAPARPAFEDDEHDLGFAKRNPYRTPLLVLGAIILAGASFAAGRLTAPDPWPPTPAVTSPPPTPTTPSTTATATATSTATATVTATATATEQEPTATAVPRPAFTAPHASTSSSHKPNDGYA